MVIKTSDNRRVSISSKNGYTYEKVMLAKQYLSEIGNNRRNFPFAKLVEYYNNIYGTHESTSGCSCQSAKYYNGINNFYTYGKLTLINNGLASEEDFTIKPNQEPIENAENRIKLGDSGNDNSLETQNEASESVSEDKVDNDKEDENKASDEAGNDVNEKKKIGRPKKK